MFFHFIEQIFIDQIDIGYQYLYWTLEDQTSFCLQGPHHLVWRQLFKF